MNEKKSCAISRRSFLKGAGAVGAASVLAACGGNSTAASGSGAEAAAEGKVINIYSWNDEFRTRLEAVYSEVASTSSDGTVTTPERRHRDPLDHQPQPGRRLPAEAG